ncbi:MAG: HlyD family secretion protein [Anaerolineae bacterium]
MSRKSVDTKHRIVFIITLVLLAGCAQSPISNLQSPNAPTVAPSATPAPVGTAAPSPTPLPTGITILADGVVQAAQPAVPLAFEAGGRLLAVHVRVGDQVQAGDLIAELDDTEARAQVEQARLDLRLAELAVEDLKQQPRRASVAAAQARLAAARASLQDLLALPDPEAVRVAQAQLANAEAALQQAQAAYDQVKWRPEVGMLPQSQQLQQATNNYEMAKAQYEQAQKNASPEQVASAQAQVEQAQAELDALLAGPSAKDQATAEINVTRARLALESAQRRLDRTKLRAPVSGTVVSIEAAPGALVGSGAPVVLLLDTSRLEFHTTNLSERDLAQISPGQTALVTLKAYPDDPIAATVKRIGVQAGPPLGDAATFPVVLDLGETDLDIRPGMTGRAEIRHTE